MTTKTGFVFPGQGAQTVGMLFELAQRYPIIEAHYQKASSLLGYDLWSLVQNGPDTQLNQTEYTQPALLVGSVSLWMICQSQGGYGADVMAGHSLGEYTALVCSNALDFSEAISLVALRGRYMQEAVKAGEGAMAAIVGLDDDIIQEICALAAQGQILSPANFNSIGQTVVAGETLAVERAIELARTKGAKIAQKIPVSVPSHCSLMEPAAERLKPHLMQTSFRTPRVDIINNADVEIYSEEDSIRAGLVKQLSSPVRWVETIQKMAVMGVNNIIECGPGKILSSLIKRIDPTIKCQKIEEILQ